MSDGSTDNQQQHAQRAAGQNAHVTVAAISESQGEYAQGNNEHQHLVVQMCLCVLGKERHADHDEGQRQAMHKA